VEISVTSKGRPFDVRQAVDDDIVRLDAGDREHGLLRVARFTGSLSSTHDRESGTTQVTCEVYEPVRPKSAMEGIPRLAQVVHVHSHPRCLWVGGEYYAGTACELLDKDSPKLWELFFGPLSDLSQAWLGIEHVGVNDDDDDENYGYGYDDIYRATTKDDVIARITDRAVETYFQQAFDSRRVLVLARGTGSAIGRGVALWAIERGLAYFFSEADFKRRIAELGLR
jgi:hypothetical protein